MGWLGKSQGIFKLHDSDNYCGSYISVKDATEILDVQVSELKDIHKTIIEGIEVISELDLHKAWGRGILLSPYKPRIGNASRSFDEIIVLNLLKLHLPSCNLEEQVRFGRKYVDIKVTYKKVPLFIEFVGPSHFIPQYGRNPTSPLARKREIEDYFGSECVIWPYWIQRCRRNVLALFENEREGLASVWSTRAHFGDFIYSRSADIIIEISERFGAIKNNGIGYMYGNSHTNKPIHPIINRIINEKEASERLIPAGNDLPYSYWLPKELQLEK